MTYLIGLICFLFFAVFSSQTLVDICDTLVVFTAAILIYKNKDFTFLRQLGRFWFFWFLWLFVIFLGLYINKPNNDIQNFPWIYFLEFRWFFSFFALIYILIQIKNISTLIQCLGLTILILNLIALALYFIRHDYRAGGIYNGVMAFSQNMGLVVCFFVTYLTCIYKYNLNFKTQKSADLKKIFLLVAFTSILLVLLTLTRGIWLASALGISVSSFFIPRRVFIYTLISITGLFLTVSLVSGSFNQRLYSTAGDAQTSNNQRKNLWRANIEIFKDFPILGAGYTLNNSRLTEYFEKLNIAQTEFKSHAHNQYLHFAAGTGVLGLLFYLTFLIYILKTATTGFIQSSDIHLKSIYLSLLSALISFVIAGLTESNFSISKNRFLFLFFCAFVIAENERRQRQI